MATKKTTSTKFEATDDVEQVEKTPAQLQREADGHAHGTRMMSADEVHELHGRDVVKANEAKARERRKQS